MKRKVIIGAVLLLTIAMTGCTTPTAKNIGTSGYADAAKLLTEVKTTQFFTDEKIPNEDIEKILSAGVNAPSAMNTQPWHFTAITDKEVSQKLTDAMGSMKPPAMNGDFPAGPPAKGGEGKVPPEGAPKDAPKPPEGTAKAPEGAPNPPQGKEGFSKAPNKAGIGDAPLTIVISCEEGAELSAGLAVQNMSAAAQLLGYGTKILTSPTMALNGDNQAEFKDLLKIPDNQKVAAVLIVGKPATEGDNPDAVTSATTRNDYDQVVTIIGE